MFSSLIVIGGGIIGLTAAIEAAKLGIKVRLFDAGRHGTGASRVAAGMLTPLKEARKPDAFFQLGMTALKMYPDFVQYVEDQSGLKVEFRRSGVLIVTLTEEEAGLYRQHLTRIPGVEWFSPEEVTNTIPAITPNNCGGTLLPDESQVNTDLLMKALSMTAYRLGIEIHDYEPVVSILTDNDRVTGIRTTRGEYHAERILMATGTGAGSIQGWFRNRPVEVFPVRGQIVLLKSPSGPFPHIIHGNGVYIVSRGDGTILVGASSIEHSWHLEPSAGETHDLLHRAMEVVPQLENFEITGHLVGLRPAVRDLWPVMGPGEYEGLDLALGHYRNGILLAPVTAKLLADYWKKGQIPDLMKPFLPERESLQ